MATKKQAKTPAPAKAAKPVAKVAKKSVKKTTPKTKAEILEAISGQAGITKVQAKAAYEALLAVAYAGAKTKDGILLPGLGKLITAKRKARTGHNPKTRELIAIPAATVLKFRICKAAKDGVLGK